MGSTRRATRGAVRVAGMLALSCTVAACSDGFSRLDADLITASVSAPSNQDRIIRKVDGSQAAAPIARHAPVAQPFPGDAVTTGSVRPASVQRATLVTREPLPALSSPEPRVPAKAAVAKPRTTETSSIIVVPPRASERKPATKTEQPVAKRKVAAPIVRPQVVAGATKPQIEAPKPVIGTTYTVEAGDTVYGIARKVGVPPQDLVRWNALQDTTIRPGQVLTLKRGASVAEPVAAEAKPERLTTASVPKVREAAKRSPEPQPYPEKPAKKTAAAKADFSWPVRGKIVSRFGDTLNGTVNDGIDLAVPEGTEVRAVADGSVVFAASLENYGKLVLIRHSGGWVSAYAHAKATKVKRGETVARGQVVALSGQTGNADSPRLHFELRRDSRPVDPEPHLPK